MVDQSVANAKFIHLIFQTEVYKIHVGNILAGSSINNLNPGSIESLEVLIPDLREQNEISNVIESIDTELDELREQLAKAQKIKQGMMQELLTGRIRLI